MTNFIHCHCVLWRHAEAEDFNPAGDLARQLTEHGHQQAQQTAHWIAALIKEQHYQLKLLASPAVRTTQTAHKLSEIVSVQALTEPAIAPDASAKTVLKVLQAHTQNAAPNTVLVLSGHQPTLGETLMEMLFENGSAEVGHDQIGYDDIHRAVSTLPSVKKSAAWWLSGHVEHAQWMVRGVFFPDQK